MLSVLEPVIGAQRTQKGLLKRILRGFAREPPAQKAEDDVALL